MKKIIIFLILCHFLLMIPVTVRSQTDPFLVFDDTGLLDGYATKYNAEPKDVLAAMIQDDGLTSYKTAAAVRSFRERFSEEVFSKEKKLIIKYLLRRMHRSESAFVHVEIMHTLCIMDRYKYFESMVPELILKLDHYNKTVNHLANKALIEIIERGANRSREARIVFNVLRKMLFLSRQKLQTVTEPDVRLEQKLSLVRWAIKILGNDELKKLPKEAVGLL